MIHYRPCTESLDREVYRTRFGGSAEDMYTKMWFRHSARPAGKFCDPEAFLRRMNLGALVRTPLALCWLGDSLRCLQLYKRPCRWLIEQAGDPSTEQPGSFEGGGGGAKDGMSDVQAANTLAGRNI